MSPDRRPQFESMQNPRRFELADGVFVKEREPNPKEAWLFRGQGDQFPGMGVELAREFPEAKASWDEASEIMGVDLLAVSQNSTPEELKDTRIAQPLRFVDDVASIRVLTAHGAEHGVKGIDRPPALVAGHSLGEYTAGFIAGAYSFKDGVKLVKARGEITHEVCATNPSGLMPVREPSGIEVTILKYAYDLDVALLNSADQTVFGGRLENLHAAQEYLKDARKKAPRLLEVEGAFHTPVLEEGVDRLSQVLEEEVAIKNPKIPLIANTNGRLIRTTEELKEEFKQQLVKPVLWILTIDHTKHMRVLQIGGDKDTLAKMHEKTLGGLSRPVVIRIGTAAAAVALAGVAYAIAHEWRPDGNPDHE